jgi:hypothetical protein
MRTTAEQTINILIVLLLQSSHVEIQLSPPPEIPKPPAEPLFSHSRPPGNRSPAAEIAHFLKDTTHKAA